MPAQPDTADLRKAAELLAELERRYRSRLFKRLYPAEDTPGLDGELVHARHKYPKHLEFFASGGTYRERCAMCANRVGKTTMGAYEMTAHLLGAYPSWWEGRRFRTPVRAWAAGKSNKTTRDIVQAALLGEVAHEGSRKTVTGTGMVPRDKIVGMPAWNQGVSDVVDTIKIKHVSGQNSTLGFKSYEQGRGSFEGTAQHVIWLDEEPPMDVYGECLYRTATTGGIIMLTFTPLEGMSSVVLQFLPAEQRPAA